MKCDHSEWRREQDETDRAWRLNQESAHKRQLILTMAAVIVGMLVAYLFGFFAATYRKSATYAISPENLATAAVTCLQFGEESE